MDTLKIDPRLWAEENVYFRDQEIPCKVLKDIPYVEKPTDGIHHCMTIYAPVSKMSDTSCPVILKNHVGRIGPTEFPKGPIKPQPTLKSSERLDDIAREMLAHGYIVVFPNTRNLEEEMGTASCGYAPRVPVDLKAAVRFLRHNADVLPGDMEKIVSTGGSGGGAVSALLGVSGNHAGFDPYLEEIGAAKERDDIFADVCYCPIIDVMRADTAFEWMFGGEVVDYTRARELPAPEDHELSKRLADLFPAQVQARQFKHPDTNEPLTLEDGHQGTYLDYFLSLMNQSAAAYLNALPGTEREAYLQDKPWLPYAEGKVSFTWEKFTEYLKYSKRTKNCPAFDHLNLRGKENELFGNENAKSKNFSPDVAELCGFALEEDIAARNYLMDTANFTSGKDCTPAPYYYIRVGAMDTGISYTQTMDMALSLQNAGKRVNYAYTWEAGHIAYYDLDELFSWIDCIAKEARP